MKADPAFDDTFDPKVRAALSRVYDPCSVASGRPTSILDLGLVLGWERDGPSLALRLCVTFPGCTMAPNFIEAARAELLRIEGVEAVTCEVDTAHVWQPPPLRRLVGEPQAWRWAPHSRAKKASQAS